MESPTKIHGVNLTGWLTLESWITPELFADSGALTERDLAHSLGSERYKALVHAHRTAFITESDFASIALRGFNAVRLPVPWYVFGDGGPNSGMYQGCLEQVDNAMEWAENAGLMVLLVFSVSPGSTVAQSDHATSGQEVVAHRPEAIKITRELTHRYVDSDAFLGIELADDPVAQRRQGLHLSEGIPIHLLRNYYRAVYSALREAEGPNFLIVLPDAGAENGWDKFLATHRDQNVWLDCHLYQYLDDLSVTASELDVRDLVRKSLKKLNRARRSRLPVMVGKWSGALPYADSVSTPEGRIALERVYVSEQLHAFRECPAWFFQTWKTEGKIAGWDARIALSSFERRLLD